MRLAVNVIEGIQGMGDQQELAGLARIDQDVSGLLNRLKSRQDDLWVFLCGQKSLQELYSLDQTLGAFQVGTNTEEGCQGVLED